MKKVLSISVFFFALCFNTFGDLFHPLQLVKNQGNTLIERIATPFNF
ncbi:MAG: hypothetical protein K5873_10790 [Treponema sp.]|nr:hypothetical protein [Treponema sp.]